MAKIKLLNKGDVIRTNPEEGFWGIAIVLSEREKTPEFQPMCHIAITPLLFNHKVKFDEISFSEIKPLEFDQVYALKGKEEFSVRETCIYVYTRRNKVNLEIIGSIDPEKIYNGPLPYEPYYDLEVKWKVCGEPSENLGRQAFIQWKRENGN